MKLSLQCLSFFLVLSLLASCNELGVKLNYDDSEQTYPRKKRIRLGKKIYIRKRRNFLDDDDREQIYRRIKEKKIRERSIREAPADKDELEAAVLKSAIEALFLGAAHGGNVKRLTETLDDREADIDINMQGGDGDTALILAAREGHLRVVKELIERGANKNRQNNYKETALETAIRNRRRTVTLELINKNDQSLNALNNKGQTALMVAIKMGQKEIARELIKAGADLNAKDNKGWSALKYARKGKHKEIAKELIRNGAEEYLTSKKIKNGAKSLFFKTAKKAIETAPAVVAGA